LKSAVLLKNEEPCLLCGRAGFSKIDDLCEILNYLPASLVLSSLAKRPTLGCIPVARAVMPYWHFPMSSDASAQRNHAVACECIGYVLNEFIGIEGNAL
jgi:hypothetical protein